MIRTQRNYEIHITADSVDAKWDNSNRSIGARIAIIIAIICAEALVFHYFLFAPDRNGYSAWFRLMHEHRASGYFRDAGFLAVYAVLLSLLFAAGGIRDCLPLGEKLHCDRSQLTIAEVPWYSLTGQWRMRTWDVDEPSEVTLGFWPTNRDSLYLVRFQMYGKTIKILRGISAPSGYRVLKGLKALGVDVRDISDVRYLAQEGIRDQRAEL